jgi:hypothetical protein
MRLNPRFTGCEYQLAQLEEIVFAKDYFTKIAITGLGGNARTSRLNKGQAQRLLDYLDIWISATSIESRH